ncbi:hypothetical protein M427DRAFT_31984 [Gonapodya prolifera JEL478]|uniref:Uncharacterized protein n=1 Tax=Gonapodya prolifera (strain JEL478) TaxID=1344416 RepID=A0A139AHA4_GONPJ|nr:hypothetical protein M427DRAFT_31984 [Gonapodya prolifera JEL478]|eukprot:KXS15793.1 hypothetical protein M427DRAFT_31984 [Gonapodya prolifera JEL478]
MADRTPAALFHLVNRLLLSLALLLPLNVDSTFQIISLFNSHFFHAMSSLLPVLLIHARRANLSLPIFLAAVQHNSLGTMRRRLRSGLCLACGIKDGNDYVPEPLLCRVDVGEKRSLNREFQILPLEKLAVELEIPMHVVDDVEYKLTNQRSRDIVAPIDSKRLIQRKISTWARTTALD